jgi:uncharacterized protein
MKTTSSTTINIKQWQQRCRDYLLSIREQFDLSHGIDHFDRVMINAYQLQQHEGGDLAVIVPAVMLHDCVPIDKRSPLRASASQLSADKATELLTLWQYPSHLIKAIGSAIASHSFSANLPTKSLEADLVQDADRLDALGAIGIARLFSLGGTFGSQIYNTEEPFATNRALDDKKFALDHFYTKLLSLHSTFKTETGKRLAEKRTKIMLNYLEQLQQEILLQNPLL